MQKHPISPLAYANDHPREALVGNVKVTRQDWLDVARDLLVSDGMAAIKVLGMSTRLDVSRSSFYWYFKSRDVILQALLDEWEVRNTAQIIAHCEADADNITHAICNFFCCFVDPKRFDRQFDFAVRDWARIDEHVRKRVDQADRLRLDAITAMYQRFEYDNEDADARARILYFMQLGYHALEVQEPWDERMKRVSPYILGFTGRTPDRAAINAFCEFVAELNPVGITQDE